MSGYEPYLRYDKPEVILKLLKNHKVPEYYHEEFQTEFKFFRGMPKETERQLLNHKEGGVFIKEFDITQYRISNNSFSYEYWT